MSLHLASIAELASLLGTTPSRLLETGRRVESLCHKITITDPRRPQPKARVAYDPRGYLRTIQKNLYQRVFLPRIQRSPHSHGGVPGRGQLTGVRPHAAQKFVYSADIRNFYPRIHFTRVRHLFRELGCSADVAGILTRLCTTNHRLEQGFITSPILADRIFQEADRRISRLCDSHRLVYTRYVDDITVSSPFRLNESGIPATISEILRRTGFHLNRSKDRFGSIPDGAVILGLRLNNGKLDVEASYFNETVRRINDMAALSAGQGFEGPFSSRAELFGRMSYVLKVNPSRRKMLIPLWRALDWEQIECQAARQGIATRCKAVLIVREGP